MAAQTITKKDYGEAQGMVEDIHRVHGAISKVGFTYPSQDKEYTDALDHLFRAYALLGALVKKYPLS